MRVTNLFTVSRRWSAAAAPGGAGTSQVREANSVTGRLQPRNFAKTPAFRPTPLPVSAPPGWHKVGSVCGGTVVRSADRERPEDTIRGTACRRSCGTPPDRRIRGVGGRSRRGLPKPGRAAPGSGAGAGHQGAQGPARSLLARHPPQHRREPAREPADALPAASRPAGAARRGARRRAPDARALPRGARAAPAQPVRAGRHRSAGGHARRAVVERRGLAARRALARRRPEPACRRRHLGRRRPPPPRPHDARRPAPRARPGALRGAPKRPPARVRSLGARLLRPGAADGAAAEDAPDRRAPGDRGPRRAEVAADPGGGRGERRPAACAGRGRSGRDDAVRRDDTVRRRAAAPTAAARAGGRCASPRPATPSPATPPRGCRSAGGSSPSTRR